MKIIRIQSVSEFDAHRPAIESLFKACFGNRLTSDVWEWAYLKNPNGSGIASLCYDGDTLVGHYAAIPVRLRNQTKVFRAFLSMTTMVAPEHRKDGWFTRLANDTYELAREVGIDFIVGFPNAMSTPGFRNKLNWSLPAPDFVATLSKAELLEHATLLLRQTDQIGPDFDDPANREWRLNKPGPHCIWEDGLAYKFHDGEIDILYFNNTSVFERLPAEGKINILVPADATPLNSFKSFEYQFGGISILQPFEHSNFQRQMAMSDVF